MPCRQNLVLAVIAAVPLMTLLADPAPANEALARMAANPDDWVMQLGNYAGHRYSPLDEINETNASKLQVAWMFSTGALRGHEGGPLKIGDMMFVHTPFPNTVYGLRLQDKSYQIMWKYRPRQDPTVVPVMCCDTVNRGLAFASTEDKFGMRGLLFLHQADTTLVALESSSGREAWKVINGDPQRGETGASAPTVVKDKVLIGISGGAFGARCHLTAYDAKSGRRAWRAYAAGPDEDILFDPETTTHLGRPVGKNSSLASWREDDWRRSGGCAWGWVTYDPELNLIFYGTGNPAPANPTQRPGDNRWTSSIMARDPDTGMAHWVYQPTPHDEWEFDATNEIILTDLPSGTGTRPGLVQFNANGFAYGLDRKTGELLSAKPFDTNINWATGIDLDPASHNFGRPLRVDTKSTDRNGVDFNTKNICPTSYGAKGPMPAAYNPGRNIFVVPGFNMCMDLELQNATYHQGQPYLGAVHSFFPPEGKSTTGKMIGWDAQRGEAKWSFVEPFEVQSGVLTTAGNVAFYGTMSGEFKAVSLTDRKVLYSFKIGTGTMGNIVTYRYKGKQFVAVLAGTGGLPEVGLAAGWEKATDGLSMPRYAGLRSYVDLGGNLVVFALPDDGAAKK